MITSAREALALWFGTRLVMIMITVVGVGAWAKGEGFDFLDRWRSWDAELFITIARFGYDGEPGRPPDPGLPAFFPGMPLMLRLVSSVVPDWSLSGLLISLVAGAVAMVALARLAESEGPPGAGWRSVFALLVCPTAVFLFAGYSEALFLAFAVPAWLAARQRRWMWAGLLGAGASCVRITGLFLALALIVEFCTGGRAHPDRPVRQAAWLAVPFVPLVAYSVYQYTRTGDWLAWNRAQEAGWGRHLVWPWESFLTTWNAAMRDETFAWVFRLELAAAIVGVALVVWLLAKRRWSELTYVGLQVGALLVSSYYLSIPRTALLWWPLWIAVGQACTRRPGDPGRLNRLRPWLLVGYVLLITPLSVLNTLAFLKGTWAG
ncbi:mannosyltransferase family protein [Sinosporangium siamense]|nr:mannosyltransferase family protein [Sinosporangium siamense]